MRIYFYPECNFNINKASVYDCGSLAEWFDSQHKNPDDYEIVGRDGEYHDCDYDGEVCAVYPKIMGGKKKGKNILTAVVGLALVLATGGTTAALFAHYGGLNMAHALGAGLLLSGGGALLMGKMKMPSMDLTSDSATKENYQWNVGNLSTSRGVKGVTFGTNVIPEGELLAYRTYGTNNIEKVVRRSKAAGWYLGGDYNSKTYSKDKPGILANRYKYLPGYTEYASVSSDSSDYLEILIGAGEGELDSISDIKINDISVADLDMTQDVDYAIRLGSNNQTALKQTNLDSQAGYQSIGQTVPVKLNGSVTPLLIITPSACDSCCIAFQVPSWYMYDTSSGAKNSAFIKLKIGYRTNGSSGSYTYLSKTGVSEIDNIIALKSESAFYFQVAIKFPSNGTYQISIENDSAELNNTKGLLSASEYSGSALPDRAAINMSVDNIACYNNKEQTYPNTALIWLRIPASQTLNGSMPKITWKQTRASIYAYNGSSYVTKPADNLAWAIYDIIAQVRKDGNTYHNEGEDVNNIDFDKFVAFASFCDSIGAKGNWFLNKLDTSWSNAMSVATSCRAFIGLRSGKVCPYWDAPTEMTQIFTVGNYEDMSGVITAKKDRAKAIEATFNNEEEKFASRTVRVEIDNDHSAEAVSMTFAGLSNPVNVSKQAHYILRRNKYLVQSVKFTADIDSIVCELNDVIGIQCDLTEYGVGGRIFKVENNVISLDAPVTLESGKTYALLVRHTDGTLERNTPVETNGTYTQLTFNTAWSKPVLKGDVYSFGIANSEVRKYRVTGITRTNDLKAQIEAIEYNENVYDELAVAPYTYTNPNAGINNVTTTYTPESVELAWDANNNTSYVNVYVDGVFYGRYQNGAEIPNINSEQLVEMFPVNEYGEEDTPVVRTISNNLPTPSTPPVPIVQSTTTGCVAEFDGIPKNENIVWLIIKDGDNELGRANILGEYMSVSIQLTSGTHTLSAYFVNQFSKSSQARTFTATPLGDIQANDISATALKLPTGSILRLSAKNCTTASIAEANGVKDVSGNGNHGQAFGGVTVLDGGEGFGFDGTGRIRINNSNFTSAINSASELTLLVRFKRNSGTTGRIISFNDNLSSGGTHIGYLGQGSTSISFGDRLITTDTQKSITINNIDFSKENTFAVVLDYVNGTVKIYVNGIFSDENTEWFTGHKSGVLACWIGSQGSGNYYINGNIRDFRIYPRALSASEIKTIYMFPDDVTFGQMTADLIGANVIKASNLVMTENVISNAAQINNAVFQSLIVTNGSTVANQVSVGGRNLAKGTETAKTLTFSGQSSVNTNIYDETAYMHNVVLPASIDGSKHEFVYSFDWSTTATSGLFTFQRNGNPYLNGPYTFGSGDAGITITATNQSGHGIIRIATTDSRSVSGSKIQLLAKNVTGNITISNFKMEVGNKATDWTPAPEDVDSDINTVQNNLDTVTTNIYSPNTTTINGGKITTGSIQAAAIAANEITADKIVVMGMPLGVMLKLGIVGLPSYSENTIIPDLSGYDNGFKLSGAWASIYKNAFAGWFLDGRNSSVKDISNTKQMTLPASGWTFFLKVNINSLSLLHLIDCQPSSGSNNRFALRIESTGKLFIVSYNNSGTSETKDTNLTITSGSTFNIIVRSDSTTSLCVYLSRALTPSDIDVESRKATITLSNARSALTCVAGKWHFTSNGGTNIPFNGMIGDVVFFNRAIAESEIKYLVRTMGGNDSTSGTITADRIATDAIKSRNYSATASDGSVFSTYGSYLDMANGNFVTPFLRVKALSGSQECQIGCFKVTNDGFSYGGGANYTYFKSTSIESTYRSGSILSNMYLARGAFAFGASRGGISFNGSDSGTPNSTLYLEDDDVERYNIFYILDAGNSTRTSYDRAVLKISPKATTAYGLYVAGKARINSTDYGSDEKTKKDFQNVSTLDKLKKLRVCAWRFDEEKLIEKENAWIDKENIKIEAENKAIDAENAEIEKENELRKNRKDGEPVELLPLKEHKKLREHRIADKNANHPLNIGCMAGEFNKAFGTNDGSEDCLSVTDTIGVCMRAIQELAAEVDDLKAKLKIQQNEKSEIIEHFNELTKEPTGEDELIEPSFDELLKDEENQQEEEQKK